MWKLLIVDDEDFIREGLIKLVNWEEYGIEIAGQACSGAEALEFIEAKSPHIVVCDVKMPVMTGLELIKLSHEKRLRSKFIILSGYDDFSYVKEALKYDVENYLLKPVDKLELTQTIGELVKKLGNESASERQQMEGSLVIRNNILNRIIRNNIDHKEFRDKAEMIGLDIFDYEFVILLVDMERSGGDEDQELNEDIQSLKDWVYTICTSLIEEESGIAFLDVDGRTGIIFKCPYGIGVREKILNTARVIIDKIKCHTHVPVTVTVGGRVDSYKKLYKAYNQALSILDYKLINGSNSVIFYDDIIENRKSYPEFMNVDYRLLAKYVKECSFDEIKSYIGRLFDKIEESRDIAPEFIYSLTIEILICILRTVRENGGMTSEIFGDANDIVRNVYSIRTIDALRKWLQGIAEKSLLQVENISRRKFSKVVSDIITHINTHYSEDLTLKGLSGLMYFNAAYMGSMFRNETGEVFSDYVNIVRVQKAKELLEKTNRKANDIAENVGFKNVNYFYSVFKKYTGVTPTEYRSNP